MLNWDEASNKHNAVSFVNNIFFFTIYCVQSYYIGRMLQTMLKNKGDSFLDLELGWNISPSLFESCLPIYWSPIFNIFWLIFWWASLELTGPCICRHTQIPSFGSTLQEVTIHSYSKWLKGSHLNPSSICNCGECEGK